jgi:hypothetical protein
MATQGLEGGLAGGALGFTAFGSLGHGGFCSLFWKIKARHEVCASGEPD